MDGSSHTAWMSIPYSPEFHRDVDFFHQAFDEFNLARIGEGKAPLKFAEFSHEERQVLWARVAQLKQAGSGGQVAICRSGSGINRDSGPLP